MPEPARACQGPLWSVAAPSCSGSSCRLQAFTAEFGRFSIRVVGNAQAGRCRVQGRSGTRRGSASSVPACAAAHEGGAGAGRPRRGAALRAPRGHHPEPYPYSARHAAHPGDEGQRSRSGSIATRSCSARRRSRRSSPEHPDSGTAARQRTAPSSRSRRMPMYRGDRPAASSAGCIALRSAVAGARLATSSSRPAPAAAARRYRAAGTRYGS